MLCPAKSPRSVLIFYTFSSLIVSVLVFLSSHFTKIALALFWIDLFWIISHICLNIDVIVVFVLWTCMFLIEQHTTAVCIHQCRSIFIFCCITDLLLENAYLEYSVWIDLYFHLCLLCYATELASWVLDFNYNLY